MTHNPTHSQAARQTALVLLASEQLLPNFQSILHFGNMDGDAPLTKIFIYHTDDENRSLKPAKALARLASLCKSKPAVEYSEGIGFTEIFPDAVASAIRAWQEKNKGITHWILNATGGLKTMAFGMQSFVGKPNTTVVYRELGLNKWLRLGDSTSALAVENYTIDERQLDKLEVSWLLGKQAGLTDGNIEKNSGEVFFKDIDILKFTKQAIADKWDFRKTLCQPELRPDTCENTPGSGFIFEQYIASILYNFGITNIATNICQKEGVQAIEEIDIAAIKNGVLAIFDLKLTNEEFIKDGAGESLLKQIRKADATRKKFGGLGAEYVLVRPSLKMPELEREIAKNCKLRVWDCSNMSDIIKNLCELFHFKNPPEKVRPLDDIFKKENSPEGCLFSMENFQRHNVSQWCVALQTLFEEKIGQGQNWFAYRNLMGNIGIVVKIPEGEDKCMFIQKLNDFFGCKPSKKTTALVIYDFANKENADWKKLNILLQPCIGKQLPPQKIRGSYHLAKSPPVLPPQKNITNPSITTSTTSTAPMKNEIQNPQNENHPPRPLPA